MKANTILKWVQDTFFLLFNKRTVGVRILVINDQKVLLVKHTYVPDWYTIGGGVDSGETPKQAIIRELQEESGVTLNGPPKLFSVYYDRRKQRDDYVIFYIGEAAAQQQVKSDEIAEKKWFLLDQLPTDISPATLRRINEYLGKTAIAEIW